MFIAGHDTVFHPNWSSSVSAVALRNSLKRIEIISHHITPNARSNASFVVTYPQHVTHLVNRRISKQ